MLLSTLLTACGEIDTEHTHEWEADWSQNASYHWHACESCGEKGAIAPHADSDLDGVCDECKDVMSVVQHTCDFSTSYSFDAMNHWYACTGCTQISGQEAHIDADSDNDCDKCGYILQNLYHTHSWNTELSFDKDNHFYTCTGCGLHNETAAHTDADSDNECDACGIIIENFSHEHNFSNEWTMSKDTHYHACTICAEKTAEAAHYDNNNDGECDACEIFIGGITDHVHAMSESWQYNTDGHYKLCSCGRKTEEGNHTDVDNDNLCDVCNIIINSEHTCEDTLSADEGGHYYASTCGHNIKVGYAEHISNALTGKCIVCGYKVTEPASMDEILAAVKANQSKVVYGYIENITDYGDFISDNSIEYAYGENKLYFYEKGDNAKTYASVAESGAIFYLRMKDGENPYLNHDATEIWLEGPSIPDGKILGGDGTYFGVLNLLTELYAKGVKNDNNDFKLDDDGLGFSFGCVANNQFTFVTVKLEVSSDSVLSGAEIIATTYFPTYDGVTNYVMDDGVAILNDGAVSLTPRVYTITQLTTAPDGFENPRFYTADEVMIKSYDIYDADGKKIEFTDNKATISAYPGQYSLPVTNVLPSTALPIVSIENMTIVHSSGSKGEVHYDTDSHSIKVTASKEGTWTLSYTVNGENYEITVESAYRTPTSITTMSMDESTGVLTATDTFDGITGNYTYVYAFLNAGAKHEVTAEVISSPSDAPTPLVKINTSAYLNSTKCSEIAFRASLQGAYTIRITSTEDETVFTDVTVNVAPNPDMSKLISGVYRLSRSTSFIELAFYPTSATTGTISLIDSISSTPVYGTFTYEIDGYNLKVSAQDGDASNYQINLASDTDFSLSITDLRLARTYKLTQTSVGESTVSTAGGTIDTRKDTSYGVTLPGNSGIYFGMNASSSENYSVTVSFIADVKLYIDGVDSASGSSFTLSASSLNHAFWFVNENADAVELAFTLTFTENSGSSSDDFTSVIAEGKYVCPDDETCYLTITATGATTGTVVVDINGFGSTGTYAYSISNGVMTITFVEGTDECSSIIINSDGTLTMNGSGGVVRENCALEA